jgi:hypothetical protein
LGKETEILLNKIQAATGDTLDEVAKKIGYSRPHLSRAKKSEQENEPINNRLKEVYHEILPNDTFVQPASIGVEDRASIKVLILELAKLQAKVYNRDVIDCMNELAQNTRIVAEGMKQG